MVHYRLNLFLLVLVAGTLALACAVGRDVTRPNFESVVEGQMARSPAYDSFAPNPNFSDGLTLRAPPTGTIARGQMPIPYKATSEDAVRAGRELPNRFSEKDERRQKRGSVVYANFCQVCHGPLGWGDGPLTQGGFPVPPSLLTDRLLAMPEGQMFHVLTYGQGRMPAVAAQLSRDDRWCAILHVRELQRIQAPSEKHAPVTLPEVAYLFRQNCSACHGEDGTGRLIRKGLPNIPDFTDMAWQVAQTEMAIVNQIDYGSLPLMPSFRYKLTRDQIVTLAVYVRSFPSRMAGRPKPISYLSPVEVYQNHCFVCHGSNGRGDPFWRKLEPALPDFNNVSWQQSRSDKQLAGSILAGKGKFMLSMSDKLGSANADQMVALVREFKGKAGMKVIPRARYKPPGPPVHALLEPRPIPKTNGKATVDLEPVPTTSGELGERIRRGGVIFGQFCIQCHGENGTGSPQRHNFDEIPDFTKPSWQAEKQDFELRVSILNGKGTHMPAHGDKISEDEAPDLVAQVRSFGPKKQLIKGPDKGPVRDSEFEEKVRKLREQYDALEKELQKIRDKPKR